MADKLTTKVIARKGLIILLAAAIFLFGWGIGSQRINIGPNAIFRKPVSKNLPANLNYDSVEEVYDTLRRSYDGQLDQTKLLDGLKEGLATATSDPYTEYLNPDQAKTFQEQLSGTFTGIGAELSKKDNALIVVSPLSGFPADKAGLKPQDIITKIDGKNALDFTITEAVNHIRGPKGTDVTLTVVRNNQELTFKITRDEIKVPSVDYKMLDGGIGYLHISQFSDDTADLAQKAADSFKQANAKGVVLDMRSDPGGLLNAAVSVSSLWLTNKTVLTERRGGEVIQTYKSQGIPTLSGVPTVVLINEGSASASEITAGALKDNGAASLLGVKSFGKGSVQQVEDLHSGGELKVTIARWYTPGGKNIDKEGITPDTTVQRTDDDIKAGRDPQLDAAVTVLNK